MVEKYLVVARVQTIGGPECFFIGTSRRVHGTMRCYTASWETRFSLRRAAMSRNGLTIFVIFFGISLLDALRGGEWVSIVFWIGMGVAFGLIEKYHPFRANRSQSR
jgi:hypothetical protein